MNPVVHLLLQVLSGSLGIAWGTGAALLFCYWRQRRRELRWQLEERRRQTLEWLSRD